MLIDPILPRFRLPEDLYGALSACRSRRYPESREELLDLCCGPERAERYEVRYRVPDLGLVTEAEVIRCRNAVAINYPEERMRRRDPDSMLIGDELPSDKPRFSSRYGYPFAELRRETMAWLEKQDLIVMPFYAGGRRFGRPALLVCPSNAAFFALALADLQGFLPAGELSAPVQPEAVIVVAPPFRHTHFQGEQRVVHVRSAGCHEIFAYNLYPGPSAKKGVFSFLLDLGEKERVPVNHASCVVAENERGNRTVFLHEGASGGGKSEMLESLRPDPERGVLLAYNPVTGEELRIRGVRTARLGPVADDMVISRPSFTDQQGRLGIADAEHGWFLRVDGETEYGCDPELEKLCVRPPEPMVVFNLRASPGAVCLPWEPVEERDGRPCTNPRVILPRGYRTGIGGDETRNVDFRSFGVRMPPSTALRPDIGVMGLVQIIPAALAWLWRLVSPRGYRNPSVTEQGTGLKAEGVGSYWPFATGTRTAQANLLLHQILDTPGTANLLIPNQNIGAWQVGFNSQKLVRDVLCDREALFGPEERIPARCPLFGWGLRELSVGGEQIPEGLLRPEKQSELGEAGYDAGAAMLTEFFRRELEPFLCPELDPLGRRIIELFLHDAPLEDYVLLSPPAE